MNLNADIGGLIAFVPEPWRTYALAALQALGAIVIVSSVITAHTPAWAFKRWRPLRIFSFFSGLAPRDGAGTVKVPGFAPRDPGALAELELLRKRWETITRAAATIEPQEIAPVSPSKVEPVDQSGERGSVRLDVIALLLASMMVLAGLGAVLSGCPGPVAPVDGGPAVTPSSWTSTARVVLSTLRWAVPAARAITDNVVPEPARTQVARALDATGDAARELSVAVDAYESAGGDRCVAKAATAGLHRAIVGLARVLVDNGIALGTTLERVVDGVASVADALTPACDPDAGWSSAGDAANRELRAIYDTARGPLRRDLDDLSPMDGGL